MAVHGGVGVDVEAVDEEILEGDGAFDAVVAHLADIGEIGDIRNDADVGLRDDVVPAILVEIGELRLVSAETVFGAAS